MKNRSQEILSELSLIDEARLVQISDHVRDRNDVGVMFDSESNIIFLNRTDHMDIGHYSEIEEGQYWSAESRNEALKKYAEDDVRRCEQFLHLILNKDIVDIGCGTGGFMDLVTKSTKSVAGVEPQKPVSAELKKLGYTMFDLPEQLPDGAYDVATLFHTLEHVIEPIEVLKEARRSLKEGGLLIVEVPHARDVLLSLSDFREFTFWSEHLILHTRESLKKFLEVAGFSDIKIEGYQRYPVSNHLLWLANNKPGGQKTHSVFDLINSDYTNLLKEIDKTDTLIAIAKA